MALKALMLRKKIDAKNAELEKLRAKAAEFQTREAELEAAIGEITDESTDEERATVEAEVEALTADQEANDGAITDLEGEIAEMESQLETEENKQRSTNPPENPERRGADPAAHETRERGTMAMHTTMRLRDMNIMERHAILENEQVRTYITQIRSLANKRSAGSIVNGEVLVPEVILPYLRQIVEENSKMMKHLNHVPVSGQGRQQVDGGFTEGIWTEAFGRLNELNLSYYDVELDGYKVGGFFKIPEALIEDSDFDLLADSTEKLGRSIGYAYDKATLYGIGTKMPLGVVTRLAQTTKPADYPAEARPWADLHSTNIITVAQADSVGIKLFQELATAFGKTKNAFSRGGKWWAMNDTTYNKLLVQAMNINGAGNVYSAISPDGGSTMPVIGGKIESLEFIPDDVILAGYDKLYTMGERKGVTIKQSEHVFFTDDAIAVKGTARYDGKPVIPEAFVAIGINGVTPSDAMTFLPDVANTVTGIILSNATATVKANKTVQLTAKTLPVDADVTWTTSDATKATVSASGLVTGVAAGNATITATCGTCTAVCAVTVTSA